MAGVPLSTAANSIRQKSMVIAFCRRGYSSVDLLGLCPKPHMLFCLDAKKHAKKIKTASPHRPDSCLFAKRQITLRQLTDQTACLLPDGTLSAQIGYPDD